MATANNSQELDLGNLMNKVFSSRGGGHVSLGFPLRMILWFLFSLLGFGVCGTKAFTEGNPINLSTIGLMLWVVFSQILVSGIRIAAQWEKGVLLRLGSFLDVRGPGMFYVIPILDYVKFLDTRLQTLTIPPQKVITRDNVTCLLDAVLYFKVDDVQKAVFQVQDYAFAISQYAQGSLRDVVGAMTLDDLLAEREQIQAKIRDIIELHTAEWGLKVDSIRLLDIELPEELKKTMSRQASAEREKRATITKAEGDKLAAINLAEAAAIMEKNPMALHLRNLQTIDGVGPTPSNTVLFFPVDWAGGFKKKDS